MKTDVVFRWLEPIVEVPLRASRRARARVFTFLLWGVFVGTPLLSGQITFDQETLQHTPIGVPIQEVGRYIDAVDPASIKFARATMLDPKLAAELREKFKTPERKEAELKAAQAILDPKGFHELQKAAEARKGPGSVAEQQARDRNERAQAEALRAILHPSEVEKEKTKTKEPARKHREEIAAEAILRPREFNANVERYKSPELRQKEADAVFALTAPGAFLKERERLKKASAPPAKAPADAAVEQGGDGKAKEKPREGGGQ